MTRVAITGLAVASPFGPSLEAFWAGLLRHPAPRRRLAPKGFDGLDVQYAPLSSDADPKGPMPQRVAALVVDLALRALLDASLPVLPDGSGLVLGSHFAETDYLERPLPPLPSEPLLRTVGKALGLHGPVLGTPAGCAAGNVALAVALDALRRGDAPCLLAGGFDLIGLGAAGVFDAMGNLTQGPARPFDARRDGVLLGEGGALFVLEPYELARKRGARIRAELKGAGLAHDADSPVRPALDGRGVSAALQAALGDAEVAPSHVGWVNAHAPGTVANDPGESAGLVRVFGPRGVPVSSTKASLGHAQGGANGLEAAACVLALEHQLLPPTVGVTPDPALGLDVVHGAPRPATLEVTVSTAAAMGGGNAVVVIARGER